MGDAWILIVVELLAASMEIQVTPIQLPRVIEGGVWINNLQPPGPLSLLILPTSNGNAPSPHRFTLSQIWNMESTLGSDNRS